MTPKNQIKRATPSLSLVALVVACLALLPRAQAVSPTPDGCYSNFTTAEGCDALSSLTTGAGNTALGWRSLFLDTTGSFNTALGAGTLLFNTADQNTALGAAALLFNTVGAANTAVGSAVLLNNTEGSSNTATGAVALFSNTTGGFNMAVGVNALVNNTSGNQNTALGFRAGFNATTGLNNVYIGAGMEGVAGESDACYIRSIFGQTSATGIPVLINSDNKLGTTTCSKRFKEDIKPMDKASEALLGLKPVTFRYNKEIDPAGTSQFGLVAEEVEKLNPDLVVRDKEGKPYSVRYDQVNAMLLNEFLKEHRKNEEQEATIARLQKQIKTLTAGLQKISAELELSRPASQTALNNP